MVKFKEVDKSEQESFKKLTQEVLVAPVEGAALKNFFKLY